MTLIETMIALALGGLVLAGVANTSVFTARSFLGLADYTTLNAKGRNALGRITKDIRQADFVSSYTTNSLVFQTTDPATGSASTLTYTYDPTAQTLTRTLNGQSQILLKDCNYFHFDLYQRNPSLTDGGDLVALISTDQPSLVKAVDLTWTCSLSILGSLRNSEDVQSARIVIRKD